MGHAGWLIRDIHTYIHMLQSVLNGESFNPISGCRDLRVCTGKGGLLAFMEVAAPACTSSAALGGASWGDLSTGAIVGIVVGVVAALVLVAGFGFAIWKRE